MARSLDEAKRRRILASAFHFFGEKGFKNTSVKHIAEDAGVAPGSIYTYFQDKEELFCSAVEEGWSQFTEKVENAIKQTNSEETKFFSFVDAGFGMLRKAYPILKALYSDSKWRQFFSSIMSHVVDYVDDLFTREFHSDSVALPSGEEERKFFLKLLISGILFTASTTPPSHIEPVIEDLKVRFKAGVTEHTLVGVGA